LNTHVYSASCSYLWIYELRQHCLCPLVQMIFKLIQNIVLSRPSKQKMHASLTLRESCQWLGIAYHHLLALQEQLHFLTMNSKSLSNDHLSTNTPLSLHLKVSRSLRSSLFLEYLLMETAWLGSHLHLGFMEKLDFYYVFFD
jgi:hypothetical protein